jgi:hypothetical protein
MPTGPLGPQGPTVDPNWAWDVPGWNSQTNTGDTIGANLGSPGQASMLVEPAAWSGYITRTIDPDVTAAAGAAGTFTPATGVVSMAIMQVMDPAVTTKVTILGKAVGTATHAYVGLYNAVSGQQVAITADQGASAFGTGSAANSLSWTVATPLASGYYWAALLFVTGTTTTLVGVSMSPESYKLGTGTAAMPYGVGTTPRFVTGGTGLTALTTLPAALTASMVVSNSTTGYFVGLS